MSTNARIGIQNDDLSVTSIYTHWDGYPSHHGPILVENYNTEAKARELIALGDLSVLNSELGEKHDFDMSYDTREKLGPWCVAYGRDRGESDVDSVTHPVNSWPSYGQEYEYLFQNGRWVVRSGYPPKGKFEPLKEL